MKKHFTATAYVVSKIDGEYKVLLHKHKKLGIWIAIGGHIERNENPIEALVREVREETNLDIQLKIGKKLLKTKTINELIPPVALVEEDVPRYQGKPFHIHMDMVYFTFCKNPKKMKMDEDFSWFSISELKSAKLNTEVLKFSIKALESYV